jgi:hypothetical protein
MKKIIYFIAVDMVWFPIMLLALVITDLFKNEPDDFTPYILTITVIWIISSIIAVVKTHKKQ